MLLSSFKNEVTETKMQTHYPVSSVNTGGFQKICVVEFFLVTMSMMPLSVSKPFGSEFLH